MQEIELAYTPHPDAKRRAAPVVAVSAAHASAPSGLALMAAASLSILSTAALLGPGGAVRTLGTGETVAAPVVPGQTRVFAARETAQEAQAAPKAPVLLAGEPIALETRAASPLPVSGDILGPVPPPAPAPAPMPAREQHTLTSFDGNRTMTDGPAIHSAPAAPQQEYASNQRGQSYFPPPPVVWNNPVQWIKVHKEGL